MVAVAILILGSLSPLYVSASIGASFPATTSHSSTVSSGGGQLYGQSYSGVLIGNPIYTNNSFPFATYALSSHILGLPAVSVWLASHDYSPLALRPYLSLYPAQGNPYDFAEASGLQNGTAFNIYEYLVTNSSVGLVIGVWVSAGDTQAVQSVLKIFTYDTIGANVVGVGATSAPSSSSEDTSQGVAPLNTGHNDNSSNGVGHQTEDSSLTGSSSMYGAVYDTQVFSDLSSPSSCGTECWDWVNWIGASNYSWIGPTYPQYLYFFQAELVYWGGKQSEPSNCGGSFSSNCEIFQYDLDNGKTLTTYAPGYGGWSSGDSVTLKWVYLDENCAGKGYNQVNVVEETIDDVSSSTSVSYSRCMPDITYTQFLEEKPVIGSTLSQNPEFGTHDFTASLINDNGNDIPVNSGSNTWLITLVDAEENNLVTCTQLNNGATSSTWSSSWVASTYP